MKLNNTFPLITDNDIVLTNPNNFGETLFSVIDKHSKEINSLKGNVKWIYQNGGVGGSGGGNGTSTTNWSIFASLNSVEINNLPISLDGAKYYTLYVCINGKKGALPYNVTIKYGSSTNPEEKLTVQLQSSNGWEYETRIKLDINSTISITAKDDETTKSTSANFILTPYKFDVYFAKSNNTRWETDDNDILISQADSEGLFVNIAYDIAVAGIFKYQITDIHGFVSEEFIFDTSGATKLISLPLTLNGVTNFTNAIAGLHTFNVKLILDPDTGAETIENIKLSCNLIPSDLYLKLLPEAPGAQIYADLGDVDKTYNELKNIDLELPENQSLKNQLTNIVENRYNFKEGILTLIIQGYYGQNGGRNFGLKIFIDDEQISIDYNTIKERSTYVIPVSTKSFSIIPHKLTIELTSGSKTATSEYYYYVGLGSTSISWYETTFATLNDAISAECFYNFYRGVGDNTLNEPNRLKTTKAFQDFSSNAFIEMNSNSVPKTIYSADPSRSINVPTTVNDVMISFGIQYSKINNVNEELFTISTTQEGMDESFIHVFQNKIVIGTADSNVEIFIPKESNYKPSEFSKYHLITLYKRFISSSGQNKYYEFVVYIDGCIEGSFKQFMTTEIGYNKITLLPGNYGLNLIELSFFKHNASSRPRTVEQLPGSDKSTVTTLDWMDDVNVVRYWYKFCNAFDESKYDDIKVSELNDYKMFVESTPDASGINYNMIEVSNSLINSLARTSQIPTLYLVYNTPIELAKNGNTFCKWFNDTYDEDQLSAAPSKTVDVYYTEGNGVDLSKVIFPNVLRNASFEISLQGSSTGQFRGKNLDLEVVYTQDDYTAVYSPNFIKAKESDSETQLKKCYNSFLPEQKFTLKADIVDSSHSNNTTMGRFINENTTKFNTQQSSAKFQPYIKNCLLGFPVQLFITVYTPVQSEGSDEWADTEIKNYYLGIYNFNLGRDSWHNLGYVDLENSFGSVDFKNGFNVYAIPPTIVKQPGLLVAEVAGGSPYYDFSQYDRSILFNKNEHDSLGMFGDLVGTSSSGLKDSEYSTIQQFVKSVAQAGGYIYTNIGKNFGPIEEKYSASIDDEHPLDSRNQVPDWRIQYHREIDGSTHNYIPYREGYDANNYYLGDPKLADLIRNVKGGTSEDDVDTKPFVDYNSLVEYYTICMVMGLVDSVQKNLNIKSWTANNWLDVNKTQSNATFYLAFYDMDTCLGIDNAGNPVTYFAFSDYWKSKSSISGDLLIPEAITIYRDFYPERSKAKDFDVPVGYDIPATYLFAIAKYAKIFDIKNANGGMSLDIGDAESSHPSNLYAYWRRTGKPLENAEKFVKTYFADHLTKVSECALNFNYRFKYFIKESLTFNDYNFKPFKGKRINKLIDWMNGRLHILDAYFNLNCVSTNFQKYDIETKTWSKFDVNGKEVFEYTPLNKYIDTSNQDIIVLTDIFSSAQSTGQKYGSDININVQTGDFTPIVLSGPQVPVRYLLEDANATYKIQIPITGNLYYRLGGSTDWRYINNISSLITDTASFNINSDKIENLVGDKGTCTSWNINLPAVKTISLTSPDYSGTLTMAGRENFPNIDTININKSKLSLDLSNLPVRRISATSVKSGAINISNCNDIQEVLLTGSTITSLTISPLWVNRLVIDNTWGKITDLSVKGKENEPFSIKITGNQALTTLTINGQCTSIEIDGCPKLRSITIGATQNGVQHTLHTLKITNCNTSNEFGFKLNHEINGCVDLRKFTALETITFSKTLNIGCVYLPNNPIKIVSGMFTDTGVYFINTNVGPNSKLIITGSSAFSGLRNFRPIIGGPDTNSETGFSPILDNDGNEQYINLELDKSLTTLASTFTNAVSLTSADAKWFLETVCQNVEKITSIASLFCWCNKIEYTIKEFLDDYKNQTFKYDLRKFVNVTNATYVFYDCKFNGILHRYMLRGIGSAIYETGKLNCHSFCSSSCITEDAFYDVIDYMSNLPLLMPISSGSRTYKIIDVTETEKTATAENNYTYSLKYISDINGHRIYLKNILNYIDDNAQIYVDESTFRTPNVEEGETIGFYPEKLEYLDNFNFIGDVDYSGLFVDYKYNSLKRVFFSFGISSSAKMYDKFKTLQQCNIQTCSSLCQIYNSFNISNEDNVVDLFTLFGETIFNNIFSSSLSLYGADPATTRNTYKFSSQTVGNCMNFHKFITKENFNRIFEIASQNSETITSIENLFRNCIVGVESIDDNRLDITIIPEQTGNAIILTNCISVNYLFDNCCFVLTEQTPTGSELSLMYKNLNNRIIVPMSLTQNTTLAIKNCKQYQRTFSNLTINNNLPFDFFNKRYAENVMPAYVREYDYTDNGICYYYEWQREQTGVEIDQTTGEQIPIYEDKYVATQKTYYFSTSYPAKKYTYNYHNDITDASYCFANTTIINSSNAYYFDTTAVISSDGEINIPFDRVERNDNKQLYTTYENSYKECNAKDIKQYQVVLNSEISDCQNIQGLHHNNVNMNITDSSGITRTILENVKNFYIETKDNVLNDTLHSLILPPDILYGCNKSSTNIIGMFDGFNGIGILPKNLLKNCKTTSLKNTFNKNFVLPQLYFEFANEYVEIDGKSIPKNYNKVYVYVPESFTECVNLNDAFRFKFNLPQGSFKADDLIGGQTTNHEHLYIFATNSIPTSFTSMENGLPQYYRSFLNDTYLAMSSPGFIYNKYDFGIKFGLMCEPVHSIKDGIKQITDIKQGFDMSKFTEFTKNMSNFIPTHLMQIINGLIFDENFNIGIANAPNGYIMTVNNINKNNVLEDNMSNITNSWAAISKTIKLPKQTIGNTKAIYIESQHMVINLTDDNVISPKPSKDFYINNIMGGSGSITWN